MDLKWLNSQKEQGCVQAVGQRKMCKTDVIGCGKLEKYVPKTFASTVHTFQILRVNKPTMIWKNYKTWDSWNKIHYTNVIIKSKEGLLVLKQN